MALGLCCKLIEERTTTRGNVREVNLFDERSLQLGRWQRGEYSEERVRGTYHHNLDSLLDGLVLVDGMRIRCLRLSSGLLPLADRVPREWWDNPDVRNRFARIGKFARERGIRLTMHPGQFVVLTSDSDRVVQNSVTELMLHGWIMDAMELDRTPYYAINIHGGKRDRIQQLITNILHLDPSVKQRLTLENCERGYSVAQLDPVSYATGVPIVFDSHHHRFNDGNMTIYVASSMAMETWHIKCIKPLQHLSNTRPEFEEHGTFNQRRRHSDYMHNIPRCQRTLNELDAVDIEFEFKKKNLAIMRAVSEHGLRM